MKIFISSLIGGFAPFRDAARRAVTTLRHQPVMAEDFGARTSSPQVACLQGLRQSDLVVLIMGDGYGLVQGGSGLSATHEEYREARGQKQVLAFVQQGITPEPQQAAFIAEVEGWESGLYRAGFTDAEDLHAGIVRALHDVAITEAAGASDPDEMSRRAVAILPPENRNMVTAATVDVVVAAGPRQQVLRSIEIEAPGFSDELLQSALFGRDKLFRSDLANDVRLKGGTLVLRQDRGGAVSLGEDGTILIRQLLDEPRNGRGFDMTGYMVVIEEVVQHRLATALGFASSLLYRLDATERVTDTAVAVRIAGAENRAWRTKAQNDASPGSVTIGMKIRERQPVVKVQRRGALRVDRTRLIEDLLVLLRRQFPTGG